MKDLPERLRHLFTNPYKAMERTPPMPSTHQSRGRLLGRLRRQREPLSTLGFADLTPPYDWYRIEAEMLLAPDSIERTVALLAIREVRRSAPNDPMIPDRRR